MQQRGKPKMLKYGILPVVLLTCAFVKADAGANSHAHALLLMEEVHEREESSPTASPTAQRESHTNIASHITQKTVAWHKLGISLERA